MFVDRSACGQAYATALLQLSGRKRARNQSEKLFAFLPLAILHSRRGKDLSATPQYEDLTPEEQFAVHILYDVIAEIDDPIANYPRVMGEIAILRNMIAGLIKVSTPRQGQTEDLIQMAVKIVMVAREYGAPDPKLPKIQTVVDDIGWHETHRDPDLWHIIVREANFDLKSCRNFAEWVIDESDCDRATAAFLFLTLDGPEFVTNMSEAAVREAKFRNQVITRICLRSQSGDGFPNSKLTLSEHGLADNQRDALKRMLEASMTATAMGFPMPVKLLSTPFSGRRAKSHYIFHSECYIENGW